MCIDNLSHTSLKRLASYGCLMNSASNFMSSSISSIGEWAVFLCDYMILKYNVISKKYLTCVNPHEYSKRIYVSQLNRDDFVSCFSSIFYSGPNIAPDGIIHSGPSQIYRSFAKIGAHIHKNYQSIY